MPLALGCFEAAAQMVPVHDSPAADADTPAYSESTQASLSSSSFEATASANGAAAVQLPPFPQLHPRPKMGAFSTVAMGFTASTLGSGVELATPLARKLNLRFGGTYVNVQVPFTVDGVNYNMALKLASGQGMLDWFPKGGGFHVSAGALYLTNAVGASAAVGPGQQFQLGGTSYINSVDDPVGGTASLRFQRKVAPMMLLGFGNLLPRSGRHISVPLEFGGAYLAPPIAGLQLAGTACTNQGCFNAATDPTAQASLAREEDKLNRDLRYLQVYPIVSLGFAFRF